MSLEKLELARVVSIKLSKDKSTVNIIDGSDGAFDDDFNKKEFGDLIKDLQYIHNKMIEAVV